MSVGVVPASKTTEEETDGWDIGKFFRDGYVYGPEDEEIANTRFGAASKVGDTIAVKLDLDEHTVAFEENGAEVATVSVPDEPHFFAFQSSEGVGRYADATVTITEFVM